MEVILESLEESLRAINRADEILWHKGENVVRDSLNIAKLHLRIAIKLVKEIEDENKELQS